MQIAVYSSDNGEREYIVAMSKQDDPFQFEEIETTGATLQTVIDGGELANTMRPDTKYTRS